MHIVGVDVNRYRIHLAPTDSKYNVPRATDENYIHALNEIVKKGGVEFVHPQPDIEVRVISENREKLEAQTFLPFKRAVKVCQDKYESAKAWLRKNVPTARTIEIKTEKDIEKAFEEFGNQYGLGQNMELEEKGVHRPTT